MIRSSLDSTLSSRALSRVSIPSILAVRLMLLWLLEPGGSDGVGAGSADGDVGAVGGEFGEVEEQGPLREAEPLASTVIEKVQNVNGASVSQPSWEHDTV